MNAAKAVRTERRRFDGGQNFVGVIGAVVVADAFERDPAWRVRERYHERLLLVCRSNTQMEKSVTQTEDVWWD